MASYATLAQLQAVAATYGVVIASDDEGQRALDLASGDLDSFLVGTGPVDTDSLSDEQMDALTDATCIQACFRIAQGGELMLGLDDGVASLGIVSFSLRTPARLSPEASDRVSGIGLLKRSGCAPPPAA